MCYKDKIDVEPCLDFFEINREEFKELFTVCGYENYDGESPKKVAAKIKRFVKART